MAVEVPLRRAAEIALVLALIVGCTPAMPVMPTPDPSPASPPAATTPPEEGDLDHVHHPPGVSAQERIAEALEAGRIDHPTSLLYRMHALHGDPRLPPDLQGDHALDEDLALDLELAFEAESLPSETGEALRPFLVRPDDPDSIHARIATEAGPPRTTVTLAAAGPQVEPCQPIEYDRPTPWTSAAAGAAPGFRVHAQCLFDYEAAILRAVAVLGHLWGPMTAMMGPPLADEGGPTHGGDSAIDFYLVPAYEPCIDRPVEEFGQRTWRDPCLDGGAGRAIPAPPTQGPAGAKASSGFLLIPLAVASQPERLRATLAHELFHALQFAHNAQGLSVPGGSHWFTEASAEWAEAFYAPASASTTHATWYPVFQRSDVPLHQASNPWSPPERKGYRVYVWPLLLQLIGDREPALIAGAWDRMVGQRGQGALDAAVEGTVRFRDRFPDFALLNLRSVDLSAALGMRWEDVAPDLPPTLPSGGRVPRGLDVSVPASAKEAALRVPERLLPMTSHYHGFRPTEDVRRMELDFAGFAAQEGAIDVVVEWNGDKGTERRTIAPGGRTEVCWGEDGFRAVYAVLSHADIAANRVAEGSFTVWGSDAGCQGYEIAYDYSGSGPDIASIGYRLTGRIEPDDAGGFAGLGWFTGTYWQASEFRGGEIVYCTELPISGEMELFGYIDGGQLTVLGVPTEDTTAELGLLVLQVSAGGEVPEEGGTQVLREPARYRPSDDVPGIAFCPDFADVNTTFTATLLGR